MQWLNEIGSSLVFTREYLKAGVFVSLLSVWVLVALFFYLNHYTKRRYFTIWTVTWLFYALWITLSFGRQAAAWENPLTLVIQQWCVGISAIFLFWGSLLFLERPVKIPMVAGFVVFTGFWTWLGAYHFSKPLALELPVFWLIALASGMAGIAFIRYRRKHPYIGATLLGTGFFLWGVYMAGYPFLEHSEDLTSVALFISAGLQIFLAVSMIILVLEEARQTYQLALEQALTQKAERDELRSRVQSTEERYQKLFNQASEAIVIADARDSRILELNRAAERLLGISRSESGQHCLTAFFDGENSGVLPANGNAEWSQCLCTQSSPSIVRKDGMRAPVEINAAQINFDNRPAYQFSLLELTERARLEQKLRQAEKLSAMGRMISGIAHELNNPLAVVKGYLELVLSHHELSPKTRADLERAAQESNRAAKLVTSFLASAREQPSCREPVSLNNVARRIAELRRFDLLVAKTELILELHPTLPTISADPDQVQQLLINLVNNALQAMVDLPRAGRLKIQTRCGDGVVQALVEDNGPGVPPHLVAKIFEPFFTTKEVGVGTGLGLSIAHTIMAEHQGRIFHQTSSLGGAGFVLEFPVAPSGMERASSDGSTTVIARPRSIVAGIGGKILVLDDEKGMADMLGEMLGLLGYVPTVCSVPAQALELIEQQDFDLVISDFRMPGLNGQQFYEILAQSKPELLPRIVFLTGDIVNETTLEFIKSTGNPHIAKPFTLATVEAVIAEAVQSDREPAPELR
jgi:PAS domain S-box-containing protein